MFFEPNHTPYDLNFRLFGVDVRVHPWFWLVSVFLGWDELRSGFEYLLLWVVCVFVSILIHELGHVLVGWFFGSKGHIVLHGFGGLAIGSSNLRSRWKRILVYFAGPGAQFLLLGLLWGLLWNLAQRGISLHLKPIAWHVLASLVYINFYWPLLNLLPIWPLDGGKISREVLDGLMPGMGLRASLGISLLVAGVLAVGFLAAANGHPLLPYVTHGDYFLVFFFGLFAFNNFQELQLLDRGPRGRDPWDRDQDAWSL